MKTGTVFLLPLLVLSLSGNADAPASTAKPFNPQTMSGAEIKAHNEALTRNDRNYIVCRTMDQTGSQVRKTRMCRTNSEWVRIRGNARDMANDVIDAGALAPPPPS